MSLRAESVTVIVASHINRRQSAFSSTALLGNRFQPLRARADVDGRLIIAHYPLTSSCHCPV